MSRISWYALDLLFLLVVMIYGMRWMLNFQMNVCYHHLLSIWEVKCILFYLYCLKFCTCLPEMQSKLRNKNIVLTFKGILSPILKLNDYLTSN